MPNRIIREGILSSEPVNALNWEEEVFYRRLLSVVDDFGRYSAHPPILRASLYPLKLDAVRESNIERLLAACEKARLVRLYLGNDGKRYMEVAKFGQQMRAKTSKYPSPPASNGECVADAKHMLASAHLGGGGGGGECGDVVEGGGGGNGSDEPSPTAKHSVTDEEWLKEIAGDSAYLGVDVPREFAKMSRWCEANHKQPTKKRFVNWLNRIDKPIAVKRRGSNI